jgi:hypothetical protein
MVDTMSCVADARQVRRVLLPKSYWLCRGDPPIRHGLTPGLAASTDELCLVCHYEPDSLPWKLEGKRDKKQQLGSKNLLY